MTGPGKVSQVTKNYAVGLEMSCPGGAYHWAPEIPSAKTIAGALPGKCELAHNRGSFFSGPPGRRSRAFDPEVGKGAGLRSAPLFGGDLARVGCREMPTSNPARDVTVD